MMNITEATFLILFFTFNTSTEFDLNCNKEQNMSFKPCKMQTRLLSRVTLVILVTGLLRVGTGRLVQSITSRYNCVLLRLHSC